MNPFSKLIEPRLPRAAVGLAGEGVGVVSLERRRNSFAVRRAGYVALPEGLLRPHFDDANVADAGELADTLAELVSTTGMLKRRRWSAALPETATRTSVVSLESTPSSRAEMEEMMRWKIERTIGAPYDELRVARQRLPQGGGGEQARYLITAIRLSVLAEYESVFESIGWRVGLILPRHMGEGWWLMRDDGARASDALLVSSHADGFTAALFRNAQPLLVRNVQCDEEDRADELYRFLLFYRDRVGGEASAHGGATLDGARLDGSVERLLVTGSGLDADAASAIIEETLAVPPRTLSAADLHLSLPTRELDFKLLAAPAGLAALAWG